MRGPVALSSMMGAECMEEPGQHPALADLYQRGTTAMEKWRADMERRRDELINSINDRYRATELHKAEIKALDELQLIDRTELDALNRALGTETSGNPQ